MLLGFVLPLISSVVATDVRVQIAPLVIVGVLAVVARGRTGVVVGAPQFA